MRHSSFCSPRPLQNSNGNILAGRWMHRGGRYLQFSPFISKTVLYYIISWLPWITILGSTGCRSIRVGSVITFIPFDLWRLHFARWHTWGRAVLLFGQSHLIARRRSAHLSVERINIIVKHFLPLVGHLSGFFEHWRRYEIPRATPADKVKAKWPYSGWSVSGVLICLTKAAWARG